MGKQYKSSAITRQAICIALKQLMDQKPLEKITISELMDTCGMRRQHFYYYFTDIYDLLRWMLEEEALQLHRTQDGELSGQEGLLRLFRYLDSHRTICLCVLDSLGREHLKQLFEADIRRIVHCTISRVVQENDLPEDLPTEEITTHFLTIALASVVESWLRGEVDQTPEELLRRVNTMFQDYIRGVTLRLTGAAPVGVRC